MKRLLIYAACILLILCSCNKKTSEPALDDRLVKTTWYTSAPMYQSLYGGKCYDVLKFISTTEVENYIIKNDIVDHSYGTFKYTLNYPDLTIIDGDHLREYTFKNSGELKNKNEDVSIQLLRGSTYKKQK